MRQIFIQEDFQGVSWGLRFLSKAMIPSICSRVSEGVIADDIRIELPTKFFHDLICRYARALDQRHAVLLAGNPFDEITSVPVHSLRFVTHHYLKRLSSTAIPQPHASLQRDRAGSTLRLMSFEEAQSEVTHPAGFGRFLISAAYWIIASRHHSGQGTGIRKALPTGAHRLQPWPCQLAEQRSSRKRDRLQPLSSRANGREIRLQW